MADETRIIEGSFKDIPIAMEAGSVTGGPRTSIKEFPNRNTESVETLGIKPRVYTLDLVLRGEYFQYRDRLLAALDSGTTGTLIHPLYGRIDDVKATEWSLNERMDAFGQANVSVTFRIDRNTGVPTSSNNVLSQIASANSAAIASAANNLGSEFSVTPGFTGNFTAAVDKVNSFLDKAVQATQFIGDAADTINEFSAEIAGIGAKVNSLVTAPIALADAVTGLFDTVNGLYATADHTFQSMLGFFDFGDDDTDIKLDTAGRIERKRNNDLVNATIASVSLGYAYQAAVNLFPDLGTTEQINRIAAQLDDQFEKVQNSELDDTTKELVKDYRVKFLAALDSARVNASEIVTVTTLPTTARLLAFDYYGSDELAEDIINLNSITDPSFISGDVEILTT